METSDKLPSQESEKGLLDVAAFYRKSRLMVICRLGGGAQARLEVVRAEPAEAEPAQHAPIDTSKAVLDGGWRVGQRLRSLGSAASLQVTPPPPPLGIRSAHIIHLLQTM